MNPPAPVLAVGAVVVDEGRLLLIRRGRPPAQGLWSVPGGRVEVGETLSEAVEREVLEETRLVVSCGELVGWVERVGDGYHFVIMDFWATITEPSDRRLEPGDDADDARWISLSGLDEVDLVPGLAQFLADHGVVEA